MGGHQNYGPRSSTMNVRGHAIAELCLHFGHLKKMGPCHTEAKNGNNFA